MPASYATAYAGNDPFAKGQRTPEQAPDYRSPQCFRYGINEQILFEEGIRSDIERFVEGMIVTIQMWIAPISYSNRSAVVIAEAIEVDSKPFESLSLLKLVLHVHV